MAYHPDFCVVYHQVNQPGHDPPLTFEPVAVFVSRTQAQLLYGYLKSRWSNEAWHVWHFAWTGGWRQDEAHVPDEKTMRHLDQNATSAAALLSLAEASITIADITLGVALPGVNPSLVELNLIDPPQLALLGLSVATLVAYATTADDDAFGK